MVIEQVKDTSITKSDFNINLSCENCIYKVSYIHEKAESQLHKNVYRIAHSSITICLLDKNPQPLTITNQSDETLTCNMHSLGSSFGGIELNVPIDLEYINNNKTLKVLLNLRPDIVQRFKNNDLLRIHEEKEHRKWNK